MPIYEFACPTCRRIYSFLSKRIHPDRQPKCPKCGNENLTKQISGFALLKGVAEPGVGPVGGEVDPEADALGGMDEQRMGRVLSELERDMDHLDENNPRHVAHMMRKMKEAMPAGATPKELEIAIRRLEQGEDPEKVEADMGDVFSEWMGGPGGGDDESAGGPGSAGRGYSRDSGLYDY